MEAKHVSTIPEDEPITVAKLLWLVVRFDLVTVDVAQGAAIRSLHGHILTVVGNDAATLLRDAHALEFIWCVYYQEPIKMQGPV